MSSAAHSFSNIPPEILAANWPPEILQEYMAELQKDHEKGTVDDDDAVLTESSASDAETESDVSMSSDIVELPPPSHPPKDIASDDSAFSSDDEYVDDKVQTAMRMHRGLVLGRPVPELAHTSQRDLMGMVDSYLKQLDDADGELGEITGTLVQLPHRRPNANEYLAPEPLPTDLPKKEQALRERSRKEWLDLGKTRMLEELQFLAQAVFRKERRVKHAREGKREAVA
ncbi:hypothetical protein PUNSTDRAFT_129754 [Punctularia strigosozonata HHB-11173 SS5]|uniref:uncharacterized protein n=1 Tax=Punctularia strigosozonata (strain HHB-11173) TaxID=741275 RepID=UPI00044184CF|nr:uncharacterized protein PUNSTDRAFT_129754 [Punctularia strigosozonata HHB-11173 SS5]EIN14115.1 hypothetical protein PUNSTDRAFT_129754 [Punctularia strigosozonata HHB-11173 SS5]